MRNKALNTVSLDFTTLGKRGSKTFVFWVAYLLGTLSTKNLMLLPHTGGKKCHNSALFLNK